MSNFKMFRTAFKSQTMAEVVEHLFYFKKMLFFILLCGKLCLDLWYGKECGDR